MKRSHSTLATLAALGCLGCLRSADAGTDGWLNLEDQTSTRLQVASSLGANDSQEKDYDFGDVDQDGDLDLVVARKQPFTSTGKKVNLFLMNENGILVDRTTEYASASDVPGDNGFDTATNDRDIKLADINGDGWLDIITATTLTDNQAKHISHPRIYINLGEDEGVWLGWEYQDARIPQMHASAGPRFCSIGVGDVTGDDSPDLVFGDYDSGGAQIFDYNNKLLINDGNGFFTDETNARWNSQMRTSAFGASSVIIDINGDGRNDVVKQTSLDSPTHVAVIYNNPGDEGFFNFYDTVDAQAPYFVEVGDLNNDGLLDLVITDDGTDKYKINTGNDGSGHANFQNNTFSNSGGFGGDNYIVDLDNDGWNDVIITDVDVDIPGCSRTTMIRRNLGGTPGSTPNFVEEGSVFPAGSLLGVHNVAVFDIDGDGWKDLVVGRCSGTQVYMNIAPDSLLFSYPTGVPRFLEPEEDTIINAVISTAGAPAVEGSGTMFLSVNGGAYQEIPMVSEGDDEYTATIPGENCSTKFSFYFQAETASGGIVTDPANPSVSTFNALAATGLISDRNTFEDTDDVSGWTVENSAGDNGGWERVDPNITFFVGSQASPEDDATQAGDAVKAFVTQNAVKGNIDATASDVDGGPHYLVSPTLNLNGTDALIEYARWFFSQGAANDTLIVEVSNDNGDTWVPVSDHQIASTNSNWETVNFFVGDYVVPTDEVRVRFGAADSPNDSVTEAGIDNFTVRRLICPDGPADCPTDTDGNGTTDVDDLIAVILAWGTADPTADVNNSGIVDVDDLVEIILQWGACE